MKVEQYTKYYVAYLDILGFKNLIDKTNSTCQSILKIYKSFELLHRLHKETFNSKQVDKQVNMKVMSDSICFYIEYNRPNALSSLISYCTLFQYNLLTLPTSFLPQPIFIRGGIALGEMFIEDDIVFGPALIKAYLLEKNNAQFPRIIILRETLEHGKERASADDISLLEKLTFRDDDAFYTLDYFALFYLLENDEKNIKNVKAEISQYLDTTEDESIRKKYLYVDKKLRDAEKKYAKISEGADQCLTKPQQ